MSENSIIEPGLKGMEGESCLEQWRLVSVWATSQGSELKIQQNSRCRSHLGQGNRPRSLILRRNWVETKGEPGE